MHTSNLLSEKIHVVKMQQVVQFVRGRGLAEQQCLPRLTEEGGRAKEERREVGAEGTKYYVSQMP